MRILLDHCVPASLRRKLRPHNARTARQMGWDGLRNGLLLAEAGKQFDFFVTVDRSIAEQQNLATLPLPVVILEVGGNTPDDVVPLAPLIIQIASTLRPGQVISINAAGKITTITPGR